MKSFKIIILITALISLFSSCSTVPVKEPTSGYVKIFKKARINPCKVAILPFKNEVKDENAGEKVSLILNSAFVSNGIDVVLPQDVKNLMVGRHFFPYQSIPQSFLDFLKNNLNVGLVITGKVMTYRPYGGGSRYPEIRIWIEGISTKTGRRVFSAYIVHRGDDFRKVLEFGVVKSMTKLIFVSSDELMKKLQEAGIKCLEE
ncbi:hypothetical protein [Desulfurobacterium indicum]|uniref:Lipoprotein n=1 Tax=Desulfurobacterium indicum TaxID=1914305 RepID=A0A1R1MKL9_9BACT|nr:hypothetical protein [Desulfurobacterium indicum]OMH40306.1 hypothetical protein BLW93_06015 [Desulfurobacterium indicum]